MINSNSYNTGVINNGDNNRIGENENYKNSISPSNPREIMRLFLEKNGYLKYLDEEKKNYLIKQSEFLKFKNIEMNDKNLEISIKFLIEDEGDYFYYIQNYESDKLIDFLDFLNKIGEKNEDFKNLNSYKKITLGKIIKEKNIETLNENINFLINYTEDDNNYGDILYIDKKLYGNDFINYLKEVDSFLEGNEKINNLRLYKKINFIKIYKERKFELSEKNTNILINILDKINYIFEIDNLFKIKYTGDNFIRFLEDIKLIGELSYKNIEILTEIIERDIEKSDENINLLKNFINEYNNFELININYLGKDFIEKIKLLLENKDIINYENEYRIKYFLYYLNNENINTFLNVINNPENEKILEYLLDKKPQLFSEYLNYINNGFFNNLGKQKLEIIKIINSKNLDINNHNIDILINFYKNYEDDKNLKPHFGFNHTIRKLGDFYHYYNKYDHDNFYINDNFIGEKYLEIFQDSIKKRSIVQRFIKNNSFTFRDIPYYIYNIIKNYNSKDLKKYFETFENNLETLKNGELSKIFSNLINNDFREEFIKIISLEKELFDKKLKILYEKINIFQEKYNDDLIIKIINKFGINLFINEKLDVLENYFKIYKILENSPSTKVKALADNIFYLIIETENPEEAIIKIEEIFIENRLPFTAELFRIFSILYSEEKVLDGISEKSSPYLQVLKEKGNPEMIYNTFFKDLLKTHIYSGNRSLKKFLQENLEAKKIYKKYENGENLKEEEKSFLYQNTLTLATIIQNQEVKIGEKTKNLGNFEENINEIIKNLQLKNISEVFEHFEKKFLKGTGFENAEQILDFMEKNISEKNEKSKNQENFEIENGDFIKGFEAKIYHLVGNNGFVARDFLGTEGKSDATPFDIDMIKVGNESFDEIINSSTASGYGNTFAVIKSKNKEVFESTSGDIKSYKNHNFEAFKTGALGENHYGIRTGFPTSLIDFYVHKSKNTEETYNFFYSIAKSGFYIPVLDENKNVIFSYEDFENLRKIFHGTEEFSKENIQIENKNENPNILSKIIQNYPEQEEFDEVQNLTNKMYDEIKSILQKFGIEKRSFKEKIGYEIQSTGSTGRNTFLPGDSFDFDLNIKLDEKSYNKIKDKTSEFLQIFEKENDFEKYENTDGNGESQTIQFLKLKKIINGKEIEVDLLFSKLVEDDVSDTNKILEEKYENIQKNYGEEVYKNVIANIRTAKKFLKENNIYKKYESGLGGVGIETWILNNNGSFEEAVKSFLEASLDENGETLNYSDFKKKYFIYSAGENIKGRGNDKIENFIFKIGENGYFKMLEALKKL